jgi:pilus assembly protein Flp/PilA
MVRMLKNLVRNEEGATMVEYGIMVALIAAICIGVVATLGNSIKATFTNVNSNISGT